MAEAQAIIGIRLLIIPTNRQHLPVERQGTVILLERKITLRIHPVIERKLMGSQTLQLRKHLIKEPDGFGILPLIIQAHRQISPVAGIQLVTPVERLEQHQALMKLLGSEVIQCPRQLLGIRLPITLLFLKGSAFRCRFRAVQGRAEGTKAPTPRKGQSSNTRHCPTRQTSPDKQTANQYPKLHLLLLPIIILRLIAAGIRRLLSSQSIPVYRQ